MRVRERGGVVGSLIRPLGQVLKVSPTDPWVLVQRWLLRTVSKLENGLVSSCGFFGSGE